MTLAQVAKSKDLDGQGNFVFDLDYNGHHGTAKQEGFVHVHKNWFYNGTMSIEDGLNHLAQGKAESEDILAPIHGFTPTWDSNGLFFTNNGNEYRPTEHALKQISALFDLGQYLPEKLAKNEFHLDGQTLQQLMQYGQERLVKEIGDSKRRENKFLFRVRKDGTLRAVLSSKYAIIDNEWFLNIFKEISPEARLSHFSKSDADNIYGNILLPDFIREEEDSDFGGGLSLSNSEIGMRRLSSTPFVFRAICANGCVWGCLEGTAVDKVHRGKINLVELRKQIIENLHKQIPLIPTLIDELLATKKLETEVSVKPIYAQLGMDYKLSPTILKTVLEGYLKEVSTWQQSKNSLYGLIQGITRASQTMNPQDWVKLDNLGGTLARYNEDSWSSLTARAAILSAKTVDQAFGLAV